MRTILFFDLPVLTPFQRKAYRKFVKNIKRLGFYMLQESVYVKMSIDQQKSRSTINLINSIVPDDGNVIAITVTEKQFNSMDILLGKNTTDVVTSDERIIEL